MRVVIVEDETAASENLIEMLHELEPDLEVLSVLESVQQTVRWLREHEQPDLFFMDIHLSDASAFTIFDQIEVKVPIVFTTAYDQYAIDAFQVNSIDYLLKPIKMSHLKRALDKYHSFSGEDLRMYMEKMLRLSSSPKVYQSSILIQQADKIIPLELKDVACFYSSEKNIVVYTKDGRAYPFNKSLDQMVEGLDPAQFIRANKQYIIARDAVKEITIWFDSRLLVNLSTSIPEPIYVSKNKASEFKRWLLG